MATKKSKTSEAIFLTPEQKPKPGETAIIFRFADGSEAALSPEYVNRHRLLSAVLRDIREEQQAERSRGGRKAAQEKKRHARNWQDRIKPEALRMIAAGKSNSRIAELLELKAHKSQGTVARFVASLRLKKK